MGNKDNKRKQPLDKLADLRRRVADLEKVNDENDRMKERLRALEQDLGERTRELNCIYAVADTVNKTDATLEEIFRETVNLLPFAWQYPEITCARIIIEGKGEFRTDNFRESPFKQVSHIKVKGKRVGAIEVFYLEERHESAEGPFLKEERRLLDAVAQRLAKMIERKRAEDDLNAAHRQLLDIVEFLPDATFVIDLEGRIISWNKAMEGLSGVSAESMLGKGNYEYAIPFYGERRPVLADFLFAWNADMAKKYSFITKDGNTLYMEGDARCLRGQNRTLWGKASLLRNERGDVVGAIESIRDITDRKRAEEALQESERRFRSLVETTSDWVWETDGDGFYTYSSPKVKDLLGYEPEEVIGKKPFTFMPKDEAERLAASFKEILESRRSFSGLENVNIHRDGRKIVLETSGVPIVDAEGNFSGYRGIDRDITARKHAEEALRESERRVRLKLESVLAPEGDIGTLELADILDVEAIRPLMDDFYALAHFPMSIIDLKGKVLVGEGWQDICTKFHRVHPQTCKYCIESDTQLSQDIPPGTFKLYRCKNNMWDIATPIMVGGRHVGNIFSGQFFFEDELIDYGLFREQARQYGFNEDEYIAALEAVPRLSREFVDLGMAFLTKLSDVISQLSYSNIKLARSLAQGDALMSSLREREEQLRLFVEHAPAAIAMFDAGMRYIAASNRWLVDYGLEGRDLIGLSHYEVFPETPERWREIHKRALTGAVESAEEDRFERADGSVQYVRWAVHPWRSASGVIGGIIMFSEDITESKESKEVLETTLERFYSVLSGMHIAVVLVTNESRVEFVNQAFCDCFGFTDSPEYFAGLSSSELISKMMYEYRHPEEAAARLREIVSLGEPVKGEEVALSNGSVHLRDFVPLSVKGEPYGRLWYHTDITERKRTEEALRESEERFRSIANNLPGIVYQFYARDSGEWGMHFVDERAEDVYGVKVDPLDNWYERLEACIAPEDKERWIGSIREVVRTTSPWDFEGRLVKPNGEERYIRGISQPIRLKGEVVWNGILLDITDRRRAEEALRKAHDELELRVRERTTELQAAHDRLRDEIAERERVEDQLRHSQKMEAIGTLAGGIAHDFNNILAGIMGFTEIAMEDSAGSPKVEKSLQRVLKSAKRARDLVRQILAFARRTSYDRIFLSSSDLIRETVQLLRASIPATIDIRLSITTTSDTVLAAPVELQQILMNLASNSALAMEERTGVLEVSLNDMNIAAESLDIAPGKYLQLTVKDTGTGMTPEVMKRMFEPFFTTREVGKGTGMGLAVVYGIVKDLKGAITVDSKPEKGSTFRVLLPKARAEEKKEALEAPEIPRGKERILFVDDEETIVSWAQSTLERLGYKVTAFTDSRKALKAFSSDPSSFDLVITDQAMPKMAGSEFSLKLLRIRPDTPIILCTGHSETVSCEKAREMGISEFLMKPLGKQELGTAVRKVLEGK